MAAVWWRAWRSKKVSSSRRGYGVGVGARQSVFGGSTTTTATSGTRTTLSNSTHTAWSERVREEEEEDDDERSAAELKQELVEARRHMMGLLEEFRAGADGGGNNATAPNRWLWELHVAWLLRRAEPKLDASGQMILVSREMQSWILALQSIGASVWKCLIGLRSEHEATVGPAPPLAATPSEFAQFVEVTLLKMFTFAHRVAALDPLNNTGAASGGQRHVFSDTAVVGTAYKVRALQEVRHALSAASEKIVAAFCLCPSSNEQSTRAADDIRGFLSAELGKLDEALRDTIDHIRNSVILFLPRNSWGRGTSTEPCLRSSPDIHKITRSVMGYIDIVLSTKALLHAKYPRHHGHTPCSLTALTMEVICYLEEELAVVSKSFPDHSLGFVFLINNSHFIRQHLHASWPPHLHDLEYQSFFDSITQRIDRYIQNYLQLTWAPVLECLMTTPKFNCFNRSSSPLPKFDSKFQATYATQKLWKVPDSDLRKMLRQSIIEKVVSRFTEYLEDNNRITPGVTPQQLEKLLQELFEG